VEGGAIPHGGEGDTGIRAQRRHRSVDELGRHFVGARLTASSPDALLHGLDGLVEVVRAAKRNATEARAQGKWDTVDEIELVVPGETLRMSVTEFADYIDRLRRRTGGSGGRTRRRARPLA
jgi:hypothetical protein